LKTHSLLYSFSGNRGNIPYCSRKKTNTTGGKNSTSGFPIKDFGNDKTDNEGALPPHNPQKREKHKDKHNTEKKPP